MPKSPSRFLPRWGIRVERENKGEDAQNDEKVQISL